MRRRDFIATPGGAAKSLFALAQQPATSVIGFGSNTSTTDSPHVIFAVEL